MLNKAMIIPKGTILAHRGDYGGRALCFNQTKTLAYPIDITRDIKHPWSAPLDHNCPGKHISRKH
ncbi:MAG: hypothetical protein RL326_47 [Pseudomonadota bacterium]|jgi:hypothetical protein